LSIALKKQVDQLELQAGQVLDNADLPEKKSSSTSDNQSNMLMSVDDVNVLHKETKYQGFTSIDVYRLRHKLFSGGWTDELVRENSICRDMCACLPLDIDKEMIVFVRQFRLGAYASIQSTDTSDKRSPWMLEIPAGLRESTETDKDVVVREVLEETGCQVTELELISRYMPSHGYSSDSTSVMIGRVKSNKAYGVHGNQLEGEDISVDLIPVQEAFLYLENGLFDNAITLIAMQWLKINYKYLRKKWQFDKETY